MAEYVAIPSCAKIQLRRNNHCQKASHCFGMVKRKSAFGNCGIILQSSAVEVDEFGASLKTSLKGRIYVRNNLLRCCYFGTFVNSGIMVPSNGVQMVDQALLMGSMILAYMAGVVPSKKANFNSGKIVSDSDITADESTSSGSAEKTRNQGNAEFAWEKVKVKLIDALDANQCDGNLDARVSELEKFRTKRPLSLFAIAEGPRLRLLLATLLRLEKEVDIISGHCQKLEVGDWLAVISDVIQKSSLIVFDAWLEDELPLEKRNYNTANFAALFKKLKGEETILQSIRKSGKEDLYSEFLFFLRYRSLRLGCCYDMKLLNHHGVDILEDLVITLADGIACNYLELISVDSNMSSVMSQLGLGLCSISTRALQKLRNEVALDKWLHQNIESVVSMYEDRFDLCTFHVQLVKDPKQTMSKNVVWWQKLSLKKPPLTMSPLHNVVISQLSMTVKRTEQLRALNGWRYYFSLLLEFSDVTMPLVKVIIAKISSAISFFLVSLIGRSLGLIYTGIRQSLGWR